MSAARPLATAALGGLALSALLALAIFVPGADSARLGAGHGAMATYGFLLPALAAFTSHSLSTVLGRPVDARKGRLLAILWSAGAVTLSLSWALLQGTFLTVGYAIGGLALLAAAGMTTGALLKSVPRRRQSVVDVARDPLTKGDDACAAHLRFAQFFLPFGVLLALAPRVPGHPLPHGDGLYLAGIHLLGAHILVSCYGLAHLWVPRLSGVPAIAAGAIKGELHSTLLGVAFLVLGFTFGLRGLVIAGGAFAFLGAFTFMGVIGANIMRNKSRTQRVTPEFAYIPWAFTAVFWLMSGVLLGIFLNVIPDVYASNAAALRFTHVHIALLGGASQVLLALLWRIVPSGRGVAPPPFHSAKWGFYAFNAGLVLLLAGRFRADWAESRMPLAGALLVVAGLAASFFILDRHGRSRVPPMTQGEGR